MNDPMDQIRAGFTAYFDTADITLPTPIPQRGNIKAKGWVIAYVLTKDDKGAPCLDFFAQNRFTNSRHVRILDTGEILPLESYQDALIFEDEDDEDWGRAAARQHEHNQEVTRILRQKGLID